MARELPETFWSARWAKIGLAKIYRFNPAQQPRGKHSGGLLRFAPARVLAGAFPSAVKRTLPNSSSAQQWTVLQSGANGSSELQRRSWGDIAIIASAINQGHVAKDWGCRVPKYAWAAPLCTDGVKGLALMQPERGPV